jgi:ketosteroid isomerase-like protein
MINHGSARAIVPYGGRPLSTFCDGSLRRWGRLTAICAIVLASACRLEEIPDSLAAERSATADTLEAIVRHAYDFSQPNLVPRLLELYPEPGRLISASAGGIITKPDSIRMGLQAFWDNVGQNMREPATVWDQMYVDILGTRAAVVTGTYRVPHRTPTGAPHEIGGAVTLVFQRQGSRWVVVHEHLSDLPAR